MAIGPIEIQVFGDFSPFQAAIDDLKAWLVQLPEEAGKVERLFFCEGLIRPGLLSIVQIPTPGTGELRFCVDFSDQGRELMRALVAGEFDGRVVEEIAHG